MAFIYVYRDLQKKPKYVGYGELVTRATVDAGGKNHNPGLVDFVRNSSYSIECAGPFDSEATGRAVEAMLIQVLKPPLNQIGGPREFRLRPLGVPVEYADRLIAPPLKMADFFSIQKQAVLFVKISDKDFGDGRKPYDLANPPQNSEVLERVVKWWQLGNYVHQWKLKSKEGPGLLVGIAGSPGSQIVIASLLIDCERWDKVEHLDGEPTKVSVPIVESSDLDQFQLRGRRIDQNANLKFNAIASGIFIILFPDGRKIGGR